jgi:hypothetical protein
MKTLKPISIIIYLAILCGTGCGRSVITNDEVMDRFAKAGGVDEVNKEAEVIFSIFGTNGAVILQDYGVSSLRCYPEIMTNHPEVKNFPAIFHLGIRQCCWLVPPMKLQKSLSSMALTETAKLSKYSRPILKSIKQQVFSIFHLF